MALRHPRQRRRTPGPSAGSVDWLFGQHPPRDCAISQGGQVRPPIISRNRLMKTWPLLFFSLLSASAQTMTTGTIVGDVTDAARAVVRGATVSLDFPAT